MSPTQRNTLSVHIITVDEYYYIPKFLDSVITSDQIDVVGITTVPPSLGTKNMLSFIVELFQVFGPKVFTSHALFYGKYRVLDILGRVLSTDTVYSPKRLARRHDIDYRHVQDVNTDEYVSYARSLSPDTLVSVAATQKFESELLMVPEKYGLNVHSSLLPEYRGVSPSFWTLLNDEEETGITVHRMADEIDTGEIVRQRPVPIRDDDTLHALNTRVAEQGSEVLLQALEEIRRGDESLEPIEPDQGSYYSMPTREDVQTFRAQGNQFY